MSQILVLSLWDQRAPGLVTCRICVDPSSHMCPTVTAVAGQRGSSIVAPNGSGRLRLGVKTRKGTSFFPNVGKVNMTENQSSSVPCQIQMTFL